jgi:hypothetical protein
MTNPTIRIHNTETNEVIDREMTDIEYAKYQESLAVNAEQDKVLADKAAARQAVLDRLGLTEEEAQLIIGGSN